MSAPADLFIAQQFLDQLLEEHETLSSLDATEIAAYIYLASAIVSGSWIDLMFINRNARNKIRDLKCWPLVCMYCDSTERTEADLVAAKTAYLLAPPD